MKSHVPRGCRGPMEKHAGRAGSHVVITGSRSVASERGPGALIMKCVAMASGQPDSFLSLQAISGPMPKSVNTHRLSRSCRSRPQCGHSKAHVADNTCEGRQHAGSGERGVSAIVYKGVFVGHASGWRRKPLVWFCLAEPLGKRFLPEF